LRSSFPLFREVSAAIETTYVRGAEVFAHGKVTGSPGQGKLATKSEVFI